MKNHKLTSLTVAAGLLAALVAACGGDSKDADPATNGLTGDPIVIEVITALTSVTPGTEAFEGAKAAAAAVNASGGINGRPLEVKVCDAQGTESPTAAVGCARELVADKSVIAEVGDYEAFQEQVNTILAAAGVPNIAPPPTSKSVLSSPNSFPLAGSDGAGLATVLADAGAKDIQVAYTNVAQAASAVGFNQITLQQGRGLKLMGGIPVEVTATDLTPVVTSGAKGDGVALAMMPTHLAAWLTVSRSGNFDQKLSASASSFTAETLSALGDKANGVLVSAGLPLVTSDLPGIVQFRAEMAKYEPKAAVDQVSLNAWMGTWAFAQVARTISGPVTRESVLKAFSNLTDFNVFGLLPEGYTTTKNFDFPGLERLFNHQIIEGVVKDGKLVQTSDGYVPIFTPKP
ncbi:ABC transporter substrate-binding protein [Frankia sp. CNm7]|uniref:ABC transporter substrate-binding protein n=1 Tax=Frankia nepalensis TaxID=1836974 RepID=A0A937UQX2_9ACTN|nr:ABC transporter substrate-binding protein [Frankia nepalensis]MBL7500021.1 ABC transporter substrate-binding protein [Frankia nepalensis]MBL7510633.1 ABC transporter substrate-binding protein [Frankia nepalensis]MBL7520786.1 ABC transporter substrate-binding protein [Frankia nepalensis]MBL7627166.1 ABC transporter substrate-binding protein [Frankia nepalensis]